MKHAKAILCAAMTASFVAGSLLLHTCACAATPLGTAFTYQGRLTDGGTAASGSYDLKFALYDATTGGSPVGTPTTITVAPVLVSNGLFTVTLDFGSATFVGDSRWLEIAVRTNGSVSSHTILTPRQRLTPAPYALYSPSAGAAATVPWSGLTSVPTGFGDGSAFWKIGGNNGTVSGPDFIGTTDNQALLFRVNGSPALRLAPDATCPNIIAGHGFNGYAVGIAGASIGGGGLLGWPNLVSGNFGTIGGGANQRADGDWSTIGGGFFNEAGSVATVGGGSNNFANGPYATIAGGIQNSASGDTTTIGGGQFNQASASAATVSGGLRNVASANLAAVPGGSDNTAAGYASLAAGKRAKALHDGAFVWADNVFADFSSTSDNQFLIRASGGVAIGTNTPTAALDVAGSFRTRGPVRVGSETGTSEPPSPFTMIARRINSVSVGSSQVVARTDYLTLERDGTSGGFLIRYSTTPGKTTIACMGMNSLGSQINFYTSIDPGGGGSIQIYTDAQSIVHFECTFGRTYDSGRHLTTVTLSRYAGDTYWSGTLLSTFDQ